MRKLLFSLFIFMLFVMPCYVGSTPDVPGDINGNEVVDIYDLVALATDFGKTSGFSYARSDTNGDGIVDIFDVIYVASRLTECTPTTCADLDYECGTWTNGTCAGTLDCGTCGLNATCLSGTCVCDSGWGDCDNDNSCECNLSSNSCAGGSCVVGDEDYNWLYIDNADRLVDWPKAGVWHNGTQGIPTYPVAITMQKTNPAEPYYVYADDSHDDTAAINAAIAACPEGHAILFPEGIYRFTSVSFRKAVVLRGVGPGRTIFRSYLNSTSGAINFNGAPTNYGTVFSTGVDSQGVLRVFNGTHTKGATNITLVGDLSNFEVGDLVMIDQENKPDLVDGLDMTGNPTVWAGYGTTGGVYGGGSYDASRVMLITRIITAKNGQVITINKPLPIDFEASLEPRMVVGVKSANLAENCGIENMTVEMAPGYQAYTISMSWAAYCWLYKVELGNTFYRAAYIRYMTHGNEIRRSYLSEAQAWNENNRFYGISIFMGSSYNLIVDNIVYRHRSPSIMENAGDGNVWAYDFYEDCQFDLGSDIDRHIANSISNHAPHTFMTLVEGTIGAKIKWDNYFGSGSHNMVFRTLMTGKYTNLNPIYQIWPMCVGQRNLYHSFVGCVAGYPGFDGKLEIEAGDSIAVKALWYVGYSSHNPYAQGPRDETVALTILRHGNVNRRSAGTTVEWDGNISSHSIPNSLIYDSKPLWFGSLDWPPIGPDVEGYTKTIPAKHRWDNYAISADLDDLFADEV